MRPSVLIGPCLFVFPTDQLDTLNRFIFIKMNLNFLHSIILINNEMLLPFWILPSKRFWYNHLVTLFINSLFMPTYAYLPIHSWLCIWPFLNCIFCRCIPHQAFLFVTQIWVLIEYQKWNISFWGPNINDWPFTVTEATQPLIHLLICENSEYSTVAFFRVDARTFFAS